MIQVKYVILVRRLLLRADRYVSAGELESLCRGLKMDYKSALSYLFNKRYLERIVRGFFYVPSAEEHRLKTGRPSVLDAVARAMAYKKIKNWYFGLETAIKLNNLTHEFFSVDFVVSDTIFRAKPFEILGRKVLFVKLNRKLFGFGVKKEAGIPFSDPEKTLLDLIHLRVYSGKTKKAIVDELFEWAEEADKKKLEKFAKRYSRTVQSIAGELE